MAIVLNGTTGIQFPPSTALSPSATNTTSTDTGIYYPTGTILGFTTSGAERMRIDSSGNVAVGTTSSTYGKFGVASGVNFFGVAPGIYNSAVFGPRPANDGYSSVNYYWDTFGSGNFWVIDHASGGISWQRYSAGSASGVLMSLTSSGNASITGNMSISNGVIAPVHNLTIGGGTVGIVPYYGTYLVNSYFSSSWKYAANGVAWGIGNNFNGVTNGVTIAVASVNSSGANAALTWNPAFNIDTSGNLLIGRTSGDGYRLSIAGSSRLLAGLQLTYPTVASSSISVASNGGMVFGNDSADGNTERMRITVGGLVGIGTNNPIRKFVVSDAGEKGLELSPNTGSLGGNEWLNYNRSTLLYVPSQVYASTHTFHAGTVGEARMVDINTAGLSVGVNNGTLGGTLSVSGGVTVQPTVYGGGTAGPYTQPGTYTLGNGKFFCAGGNGVPSYAHIVLPPRYNITNSKMFCLELKGYAFGSSQVINIMICGYVTPISNGGPMSRVSVWDAANFFSPTAYYSYNYNAGIARIYLPDQYYVSFVVNSIAVGNGDTIQPNELQLIISASANI